MKRTEAEEVNVKRFAPFAFSLALRSLFLSFPFYLTSDIDAHIRVAVKKKVHKRVLSPALRSLSFLTWTVEMRRSLKASHPPFIVVLCHQIDQTVSDCNEILDALLIPDQKLRPVKRDLIRFLFFFDTFPLFISSKCFSSLCVCVLSCHIKIVFLTS